MNGDIIANGRQLLSSLTGDGGGGNLGLSLGNDRLRGADNLRRSAAAGLDAARREGLDAEGKRGGNSDHSCDSVTECERGLRSFETNTVTARSRPVSQ